MIMNPSVTAVCHYFRRRRALATGVTWMGANVGGMVVPPLMEHLLQHYGFQGALLLYGGLALNVVACGALLRPLPGDSLEASRDGSLAEDENLLESPENGQSFGERIQTESDVSPGESACKECTGGCHLVVKTAFSSLMETARLCQLALMKAAGILENGMHLKNTKLVANLSDMTFPSAVVRKKPLL